MSTESRESKICGKTLPRVHGAVTMKASSLLAFLLPLLALSSCKDRDPVVVTPVAVESRPDGTVVEKPLPPVVVVPSEDIPAAPALDEIPLDEEEPAPRTPGEHVDRAIQKTDEGLRKGLDSTGRSLERFGEKIEEEAKKRGH